RDWLAADPDRIAWCRRKLEMIVENPRPWAPIDPPVAVGNLHWDAFAAECGVALLAENQEDSLGRVLVSIGIVAYHYETTALTMGRAFQWRERLGDEFDRMISLADRWAGLRG